MQKIFLVIIFSGVSSYIFERKKGIGFEIKDKEEILLQRESNIDRRDLTIQKREDAVIDRENGLLDKQKEIQEKEDEMENIKKQQLEELEKIKNGYMSFATGLVDATKIDNFSKEEAYNSLANYWNESVYDLEKALSEIFDLENNSKTNGDGHDAGYHFADGDDTEDSTNSKAPYVNPNVNRIEERYLKAREDEIYSVLENEKLLDYTIADSDEDKDGDIDTNDVAKATGDIRKYILRLLMPQYKRRVEVEDLDRNFWVIGQNLTALNEFAIKFASFPIQDLISELMGIWDNIFRIW